jgi:hypothetical protein
MALELIDTSLDVICKQRELVKEALGADSAYIRLKETLEALYQEGATKNTDNAQVIANTLANLAGQIANSTMNAALEWARSEKELELRKEELALRLEIMTYEKSKAEQDVEIAKANKQLAQAQIIRVFGNPTLDANGDVTSLADAGEKYYAIENMKVDTANKEKTGLGIDAQTEASYAQTHRLIADTYMNHGTYTWTAVNENGVTGVVKTSSHTTLSDMQKTVAGEQAKGYAYNAWGNAASSSGGMIGTLIAAEVPNLDPTVYLNTWKSSVDKINGVTAPNIAI